MSHLPQEIIRHKRDGRTLTGGQIDAFIRGVTDGTVTDAQIAALAMAIYFRDMDRDERVGLTRAMTESGTKLDWGDDLPGPRLDKHSTGGVGDKVSLILAPLVAACGGFVPMISGRGLSHTGGTLDKLEAIPGYDTRPQPGRLRWAVRNAGCAIVGQSETLAPADRRIYAVRDTTATVESQGLIVASILSKKLAAGLEGLVMDVKTGNGAFMVRPDEARQLAREIVAVARGAGLPTTALITDMDQVLGHSAGNALEVQEAIDFLTGQRREARLGEVVLALGAEMLLLGGLAPDPEDARRQLNTALADGRAAERFARMVAALGGPDDVLENPALPVAPVIRPVYGDREGVVTGMDTRQLGLLVVELGGGRRRPEDPVDPAVGLADVCPVGEEVSRERPLAIVHAADRQGFEAAAERLRRAITVGDKAPAPEPVVRERIVEQGEE